MKNKDVLPLNCSQWSVLVSEFYSLYTIRLMVNGYDHLDNQKLIAALYFEIHVIVLVYLANRQVSIWGILIEVA